MRSPHSLFGGSFVPTDDQQFALDVFVSEGPEFVLLVDSRLEVVVVSAVSVPVTFMF